MEALVIGALWNTIVPKLWEVIERSNNLRIEVIKGTDSIKAELEAISTFIREPELQCISTSREVSKEIGRARKLAQKAEYLICCFAYQTHARPGTRRKTTAEFANEIKDLKEKLEKIIPELRRLASESTTSALEPPDPQIGVEDPAVYGMDLPCQDLLELLESDSDTTCKLKVISIVGFGGSGKTRLAAQVYEMASQNFHLQAWVHMGRDRNFNEVLEALLEEILRNVSSGHSIGVEHVGNDDGASTGIENVGNDTGASTDIQHVGNDASVSTAGASANVKERLKSCLRQQRYLIVIDDVRRKEDWVNLEKVFPDDVGSRIIVTTTSQAIAARCSSRSGHVYKMSTLCAEDSDKVFLNTLNGTCAGSVGKELSTLMNVCDGLPLALIESAECLKGETVKWNEAVHMLCAPESLRGGTLSRMQWVLMNKYNGLYSYGTRACLLYFHMFPGHIPIKRKSLITRWLVEKLVEKEDLRGSDLDAASKHLKDLVDGNIIRPMQLSSNAAVKSCILPGTMYEFISRKSISQDFVAFSHHQVTPVKPKYIRRLSLHGGPSQYSACIQDVELYLLRTLAVSGKACNLIMDFSQYRILRVLDLKRCDSQLDKKSLEAICKLIMLQYLSLPGSIGQLPKKIGYLTDLETLDVDVVGTEKVMVYNEVVKLPKLKHLLGKFCLSPNDSYTNSVPKQSKLETFSGFVTNGRELVFPQLMKDLGMLKKVKMWCDFSEKCKVKHHSDAIKEFIREIITKPVDPTKEVTVPGDRSLSIDVTGCEKKVQFLESLEASGKLTKLKLHGWLEKVPEFITPIEVDDDSATTPTKKIITPLEVTSLCLSLTTLCGERLLFPFQLVDGATLLPSLIYLKLVEDDLGPLKIHENNFPSLKRICLVGNKSLKDIRIEAGALQELVSLHVICKHLDGLAGIQIGGLQKLKEIALHSKVCQTGINPTKDIWKDAAKDHPNKPQVLLIEADPKP